MKKIITLIIFIASTVALLGQQEAIFSQFTAHKLFYNPGYAGSGGTPCVTLSHREQWIGLDGAPSTSAFAIHSPVFGKRVGLGLSAMNDKIGYYNILTINSLYSYRILIEERHFLSIGLSGSYRRFDGDDSQVSTTHGGDPVTDAMIEPMNLFNVGLGVYYENKNYFLGASVPRLLRKSLNPENPGTAAENTGEQPHFYVMGGVIVPLTDKLKLKPALLAKFVENAPFNFDFHTSLGIMDNLWVGATYRWGTHPQSGNINSHLSGLVEYRWNGFKIGAAYDYALGKIRNGNLGTFELMLGYCHSTDRKGVRNPRFF